MKHLKHILVGIDYSDPSTSALREAARIADWDEAQLTAIHVVDAEVLRDLERSIELDRASVFAVGKKRLEAHIQATLGEEHGVRAELVAGHPFEEVARMAGSAGVELIVLGSQGGGSPGTNRVGALAERRIRKLKQNVLLVRGHQIKPFRKVTACVDFSATSKKAARQAIHIAQQDGAQLEFLHVRQPVGETIVHPDFYTGTPPTLLPDFDKDLAAKAELELDTFARGLVEEVGAVDYQVTLLQQFKTREAIVEHVNQSGTDIVVLGTRGHTTLHNLLLGSTAEKIIHGSRCSTLAVKPEGFEYSL
ncbi:MAG: universal stress protein [Verrucomicrobiales bacterium]